VRPEFVDREAELEFLERRYREGRPHLLVIYGRRRVGKTELLKRFLAEKPCVYFLATRTSIRDNLAALRKRLAEATWRRYFEKLEVATLGELLEAYAEEVERPCLAIDEFGYLVELDRGVVSELQRAWDEYLSRKRSFLVLCGSTVSVIETEVLGVRSPLYGRRTGSWKVEPLRFKSVRALLSGYSFEDAVKAWAVVGGVPLYVKEFDDSKSPEENIRDAVFSKGALLYDEGYFLLRREPSTYLTILKYISLGYSSLGKLGQRNGVRQGQFVQVPSCVGELGLCKTRGSPGPEEEGHLPTGRQLHVVLAKVRPA